MDDTEINALYASLQADGMSLEEVREYLQRCLKRIEALEQRAHPNQDSLANAAATAWNPPTGGRWVDEGP
jgi:septal ring factor EnvC (AmiA/AmiB activator)